MKTLLLFIFLILLINNLVNCQQFSFGEYSEIPSYKHKYTQTSNSQTCSFEFYVHVHVDWVGPPIQDSVSIQKDPSSSAIPVFFLELLNDDTDAIWKLSFDIEVGVHSLMINAIVNGMSSPVLIPFTCHEIDTSLITIRVLTNQERFNPMQEMVMSYFLSIDGPVYPGLRLLVQPSASVFTIDFFSLNLYAVFIRPTAITNPNTGNLTLTISFQSKDIVVTLPSVFTDSLNSNANIIKYPTITNMVEIGFNYPPLYTIKSYSGSFAPIYKTLKNSIPLSAQVADPVGIYGTLGSYTYIGQHYPLFSNTPTDVYTQNGDGLEYVSSISWTITKKQPLPIFGAVSLSYFSGPSEPSIFTFSFSNSNYDMSTFLCQIITVFEINIEFPFGFKSMVGQYSFEMSFIRFDYFNSAQYTLSITPKTVTGNGPTTNIDAAIVISSPISPQLLSFEEIYLNNFNYLYRIKVSYDELVPYTRIAFIKIGTKYYRYESCTAEDNQSSTFEIIRSFVEPFETLTIANLGGFLISYRELDFYKLTNPIAFIQNHQLFSDIDLASIQDVSFLYNNLNVIDHKVANKMFFNFPGVSSDRPFLFMIADKRSYLPGSKVENTKHYYSKWNTEKQMFEVEFIVPANIQHGVVPWALLPGNGLVGISNSFLPESAQLLVKSSNFDSYGPIFISVVPLNVANKVGWDLTIEDKQSGFKYGEITVRGQLDGSIYKIEISPQDLLQGDIKVGVYKIEIDITTTCILQSYYMSNVILYDIWDNKGTFSTLSSDTINPVENVFINFLNDSSIHYADFNCPVGNQVPDSTAPTLLSFNALVNSADNTIEFDIEIQDKESGIKPQQNPIVYITSNTFEVLQCKSKLTLTDVESVFYKCMLNVPFGFGHGGYYLYSVYGLMNNAGMVSGYSTNELKLSSQSWFTESFDLFRNIKIEQTSEITTDGGDLWVFGKEFSDVIQVTINYIDSSQQLYNPSPKYSTALFLSNIKATNHPFNITFISSGTQTSNTFAVTPTYYDYTQIPNPTLTPLPSNPPQTCLGNPQCGGPTQGYCSELSGCVCYSPWIGNDCKSKIVIVPQPIKNITDPTTIIPIGEPSTNDILFTSLISLISLREFDFNKNIVNEYKFDKWIFTELDSITSQYKTSIQVPSIDGGATLPSTTDIKVTIQWFKDKTNITFANEQLQMHPSSIKYTIVFSNYKFITNLNTLQLIMSASFSTSKESDICSNKEFGETSSGDNSNYIKIQIQDHSLYGRFIKRAVVDYNEIIAITNTPLDESLNSIIDSASLSQSFIGINLPHYKSSITIDPDFSVLLNSDITSGDDSNSICTVSKSGLTTSQLAGIIVGCVVFFLSIVGVVLFLLIKNRKHTLLLLKIKDIKLKGKV